mmetsp:Transcript_12603/g.25617  ORF Transcript_12603/g.25617 Transcript_12603/m.25617 type:complete len:236 (-) Transcript_12603:158-865(-)
MFAMVIPPGLQEKSPLYGGMFRAEPPMKMTTSSQCVQLASTMDFNNMFNGFQYFTCEFTINFIVGFTYSAGGGGGVGRNLGLRVVRTTAGNVGGDLGCVVDRGLGGSVGLAAVGLGVVSTGAVGLAMSGLGAEGLAAVAIGVVAAAGNTCGGLGSTCCTCCGAGAGVASGNMSRSLESLPRKKVTINAPTKNKRHNVRLQAPATPVDALCSPTAACTASKSCSVAKPPNSPPDSC